MAKINLKNMKLKEPLTNGVSAGVAIFAGSKLDKAITPKDGKGFFADKKIRAGLKVAIGIALPLIAGKGKQKDAVNAFSGTMIGLGAVQLYNALVATDKAGIVDATKAIGISGADWPTLGYVPGYAYNDDSAEVTGGEPYATNV